MPCGYGTSMYNLLNESNEYVFSTSASTYSITFDISNKYKIKATNYLIETRTNINPCYWRYPMKFRLLGAVDKTDWKELDSRSGTELNTRAALISYSITQNKGIYSSFKLEVTETDVASGRWNSLSRFELEGSIINEGCTCHKNREIISSLFFTIFFIC